MNARPLFCLLLLRRAFSVSSQHLNSLNLLLDLTESPLSHYGSFPPLFIMPPLPNIDTQGPGLHKTPSGVYALKEKCPAFAGSVQKVTCSTLSGSARKVVGMVAGQPEI